ncbi:MAG: gluconeogenesis factor YvcK family protein [Acidimicrobiales bacterium]
MRGDRPPISSAERAAATTLRASGPHVVAIGGGHGLSQTLRAVTRYARRVTAIVSVADDGGSSGRLRAELGIPAPGDIRRCLGALLSEPVSPLGNVLEHRFDSGALAGHAFGNLLIAALAASTGGFAEGVEEAGRLLGARGTVLPATVAPVDLKASGAFGEVDGQVQIMATPGVRQLSLVPCDPAAPAAAVSALRGADQIVIGPGSLYTSVLAACCVPALREAIATSTAQRVYVANLREQHAETAGYDVATHLAALGRHGIAFDLVLADPSALPLGTVPAGTRLVLARLGTEHLAAHDPALLAGELEALLRRRNACEPRQALRA